MEQRLARPSQLGTNAQADRMKRMVKVAIWKRYPHDNQDFFPHVSHRFHGAIQFCTPSQNPQQFHALRIYLQNLYV